MSDDQIAHRRFQCRHIFTDGHRCGSPCLKGENFCYYHHRTRRPRPLAAHDPYNSPPNHTPIELPAPEDRSAIQAAIGEIMGGLARNALDPRRAGLMLYALQIASTNLTNAPKHSGGDMVSEVTLDSEQGTLAPACELPEDVKTRAFMEWWDANHPEEDDEEEDEDDEDLDEEEED